MNLKQKSKTRDSADAVTTVCGRNPVGHANPRGRWILEPNFLLSGFLTAATKKGGPFGDLRRKAKPRESPSRVSWLSGYATTQELAHRNFPEPDLNGS